MSKNNTKNNDLVRALIVVERIRFYNKDSNWGIIDFSVIREFEGEIDPLATVAKGEMCKVAIGHQYFLTAEKVTDPKWGDQYEIKSLAANIKVDDRDGQRKYLESLFTPQQVEAMYEALPNPFDVLLNKSAVELCKVKGCRQKTALKWIGRFHDQYDKSRLYVELADYCLTESMMTKLLNKYNTVDLVIDKVKENPYQLCKDVDGIGFKTADEIALNGGLDEFSSIRIAAFIEYYLYNRGNEGKSYINSQELMDAIVEFCGPDVPDSSISEAINENLKNEIWANDDHSLIGLKHYYDLENEIAQLLLALLKAEPAIHYSSDWKDKIHKLEEEQGWCYDTEQYQGIKTVLDNNVCIITGLAGTGKSSIVAGVLKVLEGCTFSQCALAGKAAARLTEVTGQEGKTIHRLLEYGNEGFARDVDNQLDEDVIIIDEFSMIDGELFVRLLRAIKSDTKLILLGDPGQLKAIGSCSIANDMIQSGEIPVVYLKTIHRQAGESGIIVESQNIYNGVQIVEKDFVGVLEKGLLKDLVLDCYTDKSNTYYKIMKYFSTLLEEVDDIMDLQILVPNKSNGDACTWILNNSIQDLYNPNEINKNEVDVRYAGGKIGILREGDKVINVKNNYKTHKYIGEYDENGELQLYEEKYTPIYNGNLGIIRRINIEEEYAVIDFNSIGLIYIPFETIKTIELAYAITIHKCVTEDTWIHTDHGLKQLKELNNGAALYEQKKIEENILVYNGKYLEKPSHFYNAGRSICKTITTKRNYQLTGTLDHGISVLGEDGRIKRKSISDIKIGDPILIRKNARIFGDKINLPQEWFDFTTDVRAEDYDLPKILTPDFAQFLGHMVADGIIVKSGFRFGKNQKETADKFASLVDRIFGYKAEAKKLIDGPLGGMYEVAVFSTMIRDFLRNIPGLQPNNKFVPECILTAPEDIQCAFLRGVFEDGTVNVKKGKFAHIELSLSDEYLICQIRMMLLNLGIITSYKTYETFHKGKQVKDRHVLYIYKKEAKIFNELIGFESYNKKDNLMLAYIDPRHTIDKNTIPYIAEIIFLIIKKYKINMEIIDKHFITNLKKNLTISYSKLKFFLEALEDIASNDEDYKYLKDLCDNYFIDPVTEIVETEQETYCLTMPESHQFVQNGIMGWNCQGSEFKNIIIGLDMSSYILLSKELVYTAVTRAKKKCYLCAQTSALRYAIGNHSISTKKTFLQNRLYDLAHPKLIF